MEKIWLIALAVLNVLIAILGLTIPLRIALGANAVLIFIDAIRHARNMFIKSVDEEARSEIRRLPCNKTSSRS